MDTLTLKQHELLKSFRYTVADVIEPDHDNHVLLKFLVARNFNIEKAEIMYRKSMKWRKQMRVTNFMEHYKLPEVFKMYLPGGLIGPDKQGCPVWIKNVNNLDINGFLESSRVADFVQSIIYRLESTVKYMKEQSQKLNRYVGKLVFIFDIEDVIIRDVLQKTVLEALLTTLKVFEANYPELLKRCYVVNAPKLFYILYSIIKQVLNEVTIKKIQVFGKEGWKQAVLEDIDASVLPVYWGGTRVDPITGDPKCPSIVNKGGIIPESFYMREQKRLCEEEDSLFVTVPKKNFYDVALEVNKSGSIIEWEVQTEENDLGIGVYYKLSEYKDQIEEVVACYRAETFRIPEKSSHKCENAGTYIIRFDNTFSWFSEKKVAYRIRIKRPIV